MTPEERIRAALYAALCETYERPRKPDDCMLPLTVNVFTAGLCALLAELRAPREGEVEPHWPTAWKTWREANGISVGDKEIHRLLQAHLAGWDAHAAASKARGG